MIYIYEKNGEAKELEYPPFSAPDIVGGWIKRKAGFPLLNFVGGVDKGWTRAGEGGSGVTWDDVEKHNKHSDAMAKADQEKKIDDLATKYVDLL